MENDKPTETIEVNDEKYADDKPISEKLACNFKMTEGISSVLNNSISKIEIPTIKIPKVNFPKIKLPKFTIDTSAIVRLQNNIAKSLSKILLVLLSY